MLCNLRKRRLAYSVEQALWTDAHDGRLHRVLRENFATYMRSKYGVRWLTWLHELAER